LRVEVAKAIEDALALRRAQAVEAGLLAECALLLLEGHVLVRAVPLRQMLMGGIHLRPHVRTALRATRKIFVMLKSAAHPGAMCSHGGMQSAGSAMPAPGVRVRRR